MIFIYRMREVSCCNICITVQSVEIPILFYLKVLHTWFLSLRCFMESAHWWTVCTIPLIMNKSYHFSPFSAFTCFSTPIQSLEPDLHSVTKSLSDFNSICIDFTNYFGRNYRILFLPKIVHALIFIYFNVFQLRFNTFSKRILHLLNLTEATFVSKFCIHWACSTSNLSEDSVTLYICK